MGSFPLSVVIGSFINVLLLTARDWKKDPSYYALRQSLAQVPAARRSLAHVQSSRHPVLSRRQAPGRPRR